MLKVAAILATPLVASGLFLGATGVLLVDVREGGPDGMHIVVPVPLIVAQAALSFAPEEARMVLLYLPYVPSLHEDMILRGRRILADQMEFLLASVPRNSRLHA